MLRVDGGTVVVEFTANDLRWAVFGIGHPEAPATLLDGPDELRATLAAWSERLGAAALPGGGG